MIDVVARPLKEGHIYFGPSFISFGPWSLTLLVLWQQGPEAETICLMVDRTQPGDLHLVNVSPLKCPEFKKAVPPPCGSWGCSVHEPVGDISYFSPGSREEVQVGYFRRDKSEDKVLGSRQSSLLGEGDTYVG